MGVEPHLQRTFKQLGIDVDIVGYERSHRLGGRSDAVYGFLVIEYEKPGKLSTVAGLRSAVGDLQRNLSGEAQAHAPAEAFLEKAVGIALDGHSISFVRWTKAARSISLPVEMEGEQSDLFPRRPRSGGFQVLGPYPLNADSVTNLLILSRATARKPLSAQALAGVFGPANPLARQTVAELYSALMRAQRMSAPSRVKAFFKEWDRIFGAVYGLETAKAEKAAGQTAALYQMPGGVRLQNLLFSIHTYYAFIMKLISIELLSMQRDRTVDSFVQGLGAVSATDFRARLIRLEDGADFRAKGISNFLEADFFSWYLDEWAPGLVAAIRSVVRALADFEPATPVLEPEWTRDLLQKLYEGIVPHELRHGLGEYYTPDWLAGYLIGLSGYEGRTSSRILDPACGSGTFLVQAIHRARAAVRGNKPSDFQRHGEAILDNIVGFDLNPLAVLAARTNYLIAFARFIPYVKAISIPVYLCDSVVPPDEGPSGEGELKLGRPVVFRTTKADYEFPSGMKDRSRIDAFTGLVDESLHLELRAEAFTKKLHRGLAANAMERAMLTKVYQKIKALQDANENGIWARYIKNAFAPTYVGLFDFVVGNPPWIRWGYLSDEYRKRTLPQWHNYGLFSLKGHETRLGAGEKDFSMLFTYACADRYMKPSGVLAFVITLEVFKSKGAGEGFRRFQVGESGPRLKVESMEDMVHLSPFQAANKTSVFVMRKGAPTKYPIPVVVWSRKKGIGPIPAEWPLERVVEATNRTNLAATPVDSARAVSAWQTATVAGHAASKRLKGANAYRAYIGARVEPYGVFWLKLRSVRPDGKLIIENMHDRGDREVAPSGLTAIESDLVFPAISGRELQRFGLTSPFYVLISQNLRTRKGFEEDWLTGHLPLTYGYLRTYKEVLLSRAAYQKYFFRERKERGRVVERVPIAPYWSMYNISELSVAPYRVTWKRMASRMVAAVVSKLNTPFGKKEIITTDTTSFIPIEDKTEAHYVCATMNSQVVDSFIKSFSAAGRGFGAPSAIRNLAIPKFDRENPIHRRLAGISEEAHALVSVGKPLEALEPELERNVDLLWTIKS